MEPPEAAGQRRFLSLKKREDDVNACRGSAANITVIPADANFLSRRISPVGSACAGRYEGQRAGSTRPLTSPNPTR